MTLVVALACKDGVVLASESQATFSIAPNVYARREAIKIKPLGNDKLWGASGAEALVQKVEQDFSILEELHVNFSFSDTSALTAFRDTHTQIAGDAIRRHSQTLGQLNAPPPTVSLIIVGYENSQPKIWLIAENSIDMFCEQQGCQAIGGGIAFAVPMLGQYTFSEYGIEAGSLIAYKVLTESIAVSAFGIGGPINIWTINENGPHQLNESELDRLAGAYEWWTRTAEEDFKIKVVKRLKSFSAAQ
jgi:20S proteasome alpha/beta subunit